MTTWDDWEERLFAAERDEWFDEQDNINADFASLEATYPADCEDDRGEHRELEATSERVDQRRDAA